MLNLLKVTTFISQKIGHPVDSSNLYDQILILPRLKQSFDSNNCFNSVNETQIKIIEAAEVEFAMNGFSGASIRAITSSAGVNTAAINYHFGSKEDLFKEVFRYRVEPINNERLAMLDEAYAKNKEQPLPLTEVVEIIIRPLFTKLIGGNSNNIHFLRAMGKGMSEDRDFMKTMHQDVLQQVIERFAQAISDSLGKPDFKKVGYSMHFLSCVLMGAMMKHGDLEPMSCGKVDLNDIQGLIDHMIAFISGGLRSIGEMDLK